MKLLYVNAHPSTSEKSVTLAMAEAFLAAYKKQHPNDEIVQLDLYRENLRFLDETMLNDMLAGKDTVMMRYAKQFADCDQYVIAAPFWNLSIPAVLKAYLDYVSQAGVLFQYTEQGPVGLMERKKALFITARGGRYSSPPENALEYGESYVKTLFAFYGITDFHTLCVENTNVLEGTSREMAIAGGVRQANALGAQF